MNKRLEDSLSEFVDILTENTVSAIELSKDQIPDVVRELLLWEAVKSGVYFGFLFAISVASFVILKKLHIKFKGEKEKAVDAYNNVELWTRHLGDKDSRETSGEYDKIIIACIGSHIVLYLAPLFLFSFLLTHLTWLHILVAPKAWVLEYLRNFI